MRTIIFTCLILLPLSSSAQITGNKQITTRTFPLPDLTTIVVDLYALVEVDCSATAALTITADENLIDLIQTSVENNRLLLRQKEWIQPSQAIRITIGAPQLERIEQSVRETTRVFNISRKDFQAMAIIGKLVLEGSLERLTASSETGEIDAQALQVNTVDVNLWGSGKIILDAPKKITGTVKDYGIVQYSDKQTEVSARARSGGKIGRPDELGLIEQPDARYIKFELKNNSSDRIHCYVKGPKPDGSTFSYGFPLNPGQTRKKDWTVGSKLYRETKLGKRVFLIEIKAADEGQVVHIYPDKK